MGEPLEKYFSRVDDFRVRNRNFKYELTDILILRVCAILSGAEDFGEIELYGQEKQEFLKTFISFEHGIPSHDTIRRIFLMTDTQSFNTHFMAWVEDLVSEQFFHISIDGQTIRGSKEGSKGGVHLVSVATSEFGICLGQVKTAEKSNKITAIPE